VILPVAVVLFVPLGALDAAGEHIGHINIERFDVIAASLIGATVAQVVVSSLGEQLYAGIVAAAVVESHTGRRRHRILEIAVTVPYLTLIGADIVLGFGTAIGFALLIVPGLVFYTWYGLVAPVIKVEQRGLFAALRRSRQLVRGSFWAVFVLVTLVAIVGDSLTNVLQDGALWAVGQNFFGDWASAVAVNLLLTPVQAVMAVEATLQLIDLHGGARTGQNPA
jgi:hypothetical protein